MSELTRLTAALSDRYRIESELGTGGITMALAAESRGSAGVAEATVGCWVLDLDEAGRGVTQGNRHFSDTSRAVASATSAR